jgi:predicted TIM-barrel fold metal-dependent hydrolase
MIDGNFVVDVNVHPFFPSNAAMREYLPPEYRSRGIPDMESSWYQAPDGDYAERLYGDRHPGSDPATVAHDLFDEGCVDAAILNPRTRGSLPDRRLNSAICAGTNDWIASEWLDPEVGRGRFRGTIRVNPEDVEGAIAEIERWADHPRMVQVGVPLQSREPYGKPQFEPIWQAAVSHDLPVAVTINGGAGLEFAPTATGHARTYLHYAAYMPLNYFHHLTNLIIEGVFDRIPELVFVFPEGGIDILTPLMWRLDTFWRAFRDQTPWVLKYPSEYLAAHARFGTGLEGPLGDVPADEWLDQMGKANLLMYASNYPYWSWLRPDDLSAGFTPEQRGRIMSGNATDLYRIEVPVSEQAASDSVSSA